MRKRSFIITCCLIFVSIIAGSSEIDSVGLDNKMEIETILLGEIEQTISIAGKDYSKPVLLLLHGGPGFAMLSLFHDNNEELEDYFIVVNWDQRGAGRSYSSNIPHESMTLEQLTLDAYELTTYLKLRFGKRKIFIAGHSFGTLIGMNLINNYPEDYYAFCGVGQVVNVIENEQESYDFAIRKAFADNNKQALKELEAIGRPTDDGEYNDDSGFDITMKWIGYYGGEVYGEKDSSKIESFILNSIPYLNHQDDLIKGWNFSQEIFNDEAVWGLDLRVDIQTVDVPVFFFMGRYDFDTPFSLVEDYYKILNSPKKEFVWFERSSHFPFFEEPDMFNKILIDRFYDCLKE